MRFIMILTLLFLTACGDDGSPTTTTTTTTTPTPTPLPIADAGHSMMLQQGATVTLNGSKSYDPSGEKLSYSWSIVSAPSGSSSQLNDAAIP